MPNKPPLDIVFNKIWISQAVSDVGSQITYVAIPVIAALNLGVNGKEMGLLIAVETLPALATPIIGNLVDGFKQKERLMIFSDLLRFLLLALICVLGISGNLDLRLLLVAVFLIGLCNSCFDLARISLVAKILDGERIVKANGRFASTLSIAEIVGPILASAAINLFSAPGAVLLDALTFLISALVLWLIPRYACEQALPSAQKRGWLGGFHTVFRQPALIRILACTTTWSFFSKMFMSIFVISLIKDLSLRAELFAIAVSAGGVGTLASAFIFSRVAKWIPLPNMVSGALILLPCAAGIMFASLYLSGLRLIAPCLALFMLFLGASLLRMAAVTFRQMTVPVDVLARTGSVFSLANSLGIPVGALVGGLCYDSFGYGTTMLAIFFGSVCFVILYNFIWRYQKPQRLD